MGGGNLTVKYWSSKPTSGVRFPPTSMNFYFFNISTKNIMQLLTIFLSALIVTMNDFFTGNVFAQKLLLISAFGFIVYWTISIFIFLFKRSLYKSFTLVIQRYWKRTLYLFWMLEFYLFAIYLYLILVAPTETEWLLDQPQLFSSNWWDGNLFLNKLLVVLVIILLAVICSFVLLNGNMLFLFTLCVVITYLLTSVLFSDTAQTLMYSSLLSNISWEFDFDSSVWVLDSIQQKNRTVTQYMFLLTVLKYWHTVFIVSFWLISLMFLLQSPYVGQGLFAANKQNFFFLYGFAFIWTIFLFKSFSHYSYEYVYQWFFINNWSISLSNLDVVFDSIACLL